jgi:hypothetical protein
MAGVSPVRLGPDIVSGPSAKALPVLKKPIFVKTVPAHVRSRPAWRRR